MILFLAGMAALALWWLSHQRLTAKPWLEEGAISDFPDAGTPVPAAKIGLGVFLAVVSCLFALLISAYFVRMDTADWRPLPVPKLLWFNTGLLIASSAALQWAKIAAHKGQIEDVKTALYSAGGLSLAFVAGQLMAWQELDAAGYYLAENPANSFFYLITGLHGLHVFGGLVALGRPTYKLWRGAKLEQLPTSIGLCATYWHFLLIVWLILFAMLTGYAGNFFDICRTVLS